MEFEGLANSTQCYLFICGICFSWCVTVAYKTGSLMRDSTYRALTEKSLDVFWCCCLIGMVPYPVGGVCLRKVRRSRRFDCVNRQQVNVRRHDALKVYFSYKTIVSHTMVIMNRSTK